MKLKLLEGGQIKLTTESMEDLAIIGIIMAALIRYKEPDLYVLEEHEDENHSFTIHIEDFLSVIFAELVEYHRDDIIAAANATEAQLTKVIGKMTKEEYDVATNELLSPTEIALLNFCIYWNEKHTEYYMAYHSGRFEWCFDYLKKNRGELIMENVPEKWKDQAKSAIKAAKKMYN